MPTFNFLNKETKEEFSVTLKMSERLPFLAENPHLQQILTVPLSLHSGRGMGKPDRGFRDLLKEMNKQNSKGLYYSTINDWGGSGDH